MRVAWAAWVQGLLGLAKVTVFVPQVLLHKRYPQKKAIEIATILSEGRWPHDFPILVVNAKQLGLPVSTDMPRTV